MIYITGDLHGEIDKAKLTTKYFPVQKELSKSDYLIVAGDFGCIWSGDRIDKWLLDWLENKNFTTLFVDGNHENFHLLNQYPVSLWNGGKVHQVRPSIYHLMRGQVFTIEQKTIFTFGGAMSVDKQYRKVNISWWPEEIPTEEEFQEGFRNLEKYNNQVDFVITHTAPSFIISKLFQGNEKIDDPTAKILNMYMHDIAFKSWYFGHFHESINIGRFTGLYNQVEVLKEGEVIPNDPEPRDWKIEKYLSKFKAAHPNEKQPTYSEVAFLIDKWDAIGRHITYPLAGPDWNQVEWQKEYDRKQEFKELAEKVINHQAYGDENFMACGSGEKCPKSDNCKCWKLYQYMLENEIVGHTCTLYKPENCEKFRSYVDE